MAESEEELKSLLMKVKEESENAGLKLNSQKTKIMASSPINAWKIEGEKVETVTDLFSWAPKSLWMVTATMTLKDTCSLEEKCANLDNILESKDIILPTKLLFFQWSCMDVRVGLYRKLSTEELMLLNCGVGEDS